MNTSHSNYSLRWYQFESLRAVWSYFTNGGKGHPLIALPTGTGKSVVIADLIKGIFSMYPNQRLLVLTHSKELVAQNSAKLQSHWPEAPMGVYSAGLGRSDLGYKVTFCGIDSVSNKAHLFGHIDLCIVDEAHIVDPKENSRYMKLFTALWKINPYMKIVGLTATPWRSGLGCIAGEGGVFTDIAYSAIEMSVFNRLVDEGFLAPLIPMPTFTELDVSDVKTTAGDYNQEELQAAVDKEEITSAALDEAIKRGSDRKKWLIFGAGVEHCKHIQEYLIRSGVSCTIVHSGMEGGDSQRDKNIADFKAGKYRALVNMGVLTTGFDDPEIDLIIMLRPTKSTVLWVQMLGRGTRPCFAKGFDLETVEGRLASIAASHKQNCMVFDFAGNTKRLGPINDPVVPKKRGKGGGGPAPVKNCQHCGAFNHASARTCINCGNEFIFETKITDQASHGELIRRDDDVPVVEEFEVDYVQYSIQHKKGGPDTLKVSYACGLRTFHEWICLEHDNYAGKKARDWWRSRTDMGTPPTTVGEAVLLTDGLKVPTHLRIWTNKKYPEILAYCYDGTGFGKVFGEAKDDDIPDEPELGDGVPVFSEDIPF